MVVPLFLLIIFFSLTTFIANATQGAAWGRVEGINGHRILELLDLREENNLATWYSSILYFIVGIALILLGWGNSVEFQISRLSRFLFQLAATGAILISADEVASIHETIGKSLARFTNQFLLTTPMIDTRFFWVIPFAPFALLGLIMIIYQLHQLIAKMPNPNYWQRQQAYIALWAALLFLPGVFLSELMEWYLVNIKQFGTVITCFEEMFELLGMYSLFICVMRISKPYQL
ncbi:MAG: hypothetical protein HC877_16195 [Thioploca sp.]|nr:hypothetical protein [Thioploca sp.]